MVSLLRCWFALFLLGAVAAGAVTERGTAIDRVWAGHPVGFGLLVEGGKVFVGYYDAERRLTVAARDRGASEWTKVALEGVWNEKRKRMSTVIEWDSHNSIVMVADRDGYLHLSANMHVDPLVYYRTTRPWDITSFERLDRMTGERETRCTYPLFFENGAGELFFRYRDGSSGNASELYNVYDRATRTWRRQMETPLHDGEGVRSAYTQPPTLGPDGQFHLLWMWRDNPNADTNQQLGYARSADLRRWEDSRGRAIAVPIRFGGGEIVDDAKPGEGLINTTYALAFDAEQKPVALYHRYDESGRSQIFAARPAVGAEGWERRALTTWDFRWAFGGTGTLDVDVYLLRPRTAEEVALLVPFTAREVPSGVLRVDARTLETRAVLPPDPAPLTSERMRLESDDRRMEVRTKVARSGGTNYVLRWETLPSNRDRPRDEAPPPSVLRLIEIDTTAGDAR